VSEHLPEPDRNRIASTATGSSDIVVLTSGTRLVRVHPQAGTYPMAWDEFRNWGPTQSRFDHHPEPTGAHVPEAIAYVTRGTGAFTAAIAEYFQDERCGVGPIDTELRLPAVTIFDLVADLTLLDLGSGWTTRAGGNQAIRTGRRSTARAWARAIYETHPDLDGLAYGSSVWGPGLCAALWERSASAFPAASVAYRSLNDPALSIAVRAAAFDLGTTLVR
jgi:hypothetical protein